MSGKRKGLGRGLDALLGIAPGQENDETAVDSRASGALQSQDGSLRHLPIEFLQRGKYQPRRDMHPEALEELAESIRAQGIMQPIVVRPIGPDKYEIIAGERRWRGAQLAGLDTVPVLVRDVEDRAAIAMALIENIQREDLNPIDRASAYQTLMVQLGLTQAELAQRLGEQRSSVANFLRLLELSEPVRDLVRAGQLSLGHAKVLAGVSDRVEQERLAKLCVSQQLSVRNLERLLDSPPAAAARPEPSAYLRDLEQKLTHQVGLRVQVRAGANKKKGRVVIHYNTLEEFDELLKRLNVQLEQE
ncbi:MAG TPA: ParB/RepB/Spo0J family partition protein [Porticoccaceae bacterium]